MLIGIPREIKVHEYRVGATPEVVKMLVKNGHKVLVETNAGTKIGFLDGDYEKVGARLVKTAAEIYQSDMVVKVKEPQESEINLMHEGQILFCFLHLAPDPIQTKHLLEKKVIAIAYETVTDAKGRLPLLTPMSAIAGRTSIQIGATCLQVNHGGKGILLGGIAGVSSARVAVLGGGVSGTEAARMAAGLGSSVTILDNDLNRLRELDYLFGSTLDTVYSTPSSIEEVVANADLVIGAVLLPGKTAPKLVSRETIKKMEPGSVVVDLSIDQGGCLETSKPTTHANPTYVVDGVVHYCVTNIPGACGRTSTLALTYTSMNYIMDLANKGFVKALREDQGLSQGLNIFKGHVTNQAVAIDLGYECLPIDAALDPFQNY